MLSSTLSVPDAQAGFELDRKYSLETVGALKAWDNVDGIFADYFVRAFEEYFAKQSRYKLVSLARAEAVLTKSKMDYQDLIQDPLVLAEVAKAIRVETLIRTKVFKENAKFRIHIDWMHAPKMNILAQGVFYYETPSEIDLLKQNALKNELFKALDLIVNKPPFMGQITGRDREWVTINIGKNVDLHPGDQLVFATLDDVKEHPLLHTLEDWSLSETGRAEIEKTEDKIAFAKVIEENGTKPLSRYQKVIKIIPKAELAFLQRSGSSTDVSPPSPYERDNAEKPKSDPLMERPEMGYVGGGLWTGGMARQITQANTGYNGDGFLIGGNLEGQLWMTRDVFLDLGFGWAYYNYSQRWIGSGTTTPYGTVDGGVTKIGAAAGYQLLFSNQIFGPKAFARLGYHYKDFTLPVSTAEWTGESTYSSVFLGLGGDMPLNELWAIQLKMDFGIAKSSSDKILGDAPTANNDFGLNLAALWHYKPRLAFRFAFDLQMAGADYIESKSLTHRTITFAPSLLYFF